MRTSLLDEKPLVVGLLRVVWASGILPLLVASIPSSRVLPFHQFLQRYCGRGKTAHHSSSLKYTVPQKFFCHFYVVAVIWTSVLIVTTWSYAHEMEALASKSTAYYNTNSDSIGGAHVSSVEKLHSPDAEHRYVVWRSVFLLLLMEVQVLRRLHESTMVFVYSNSARMHVLGYFIGLIFYVAGPLSLCCNFVPEAFNFSANRVAQIVMEGKNQMPHKAFDWLDHIHPLLELGWSQLLGAFILLWGSVHQWRCHAILGKLRHGKERAGDYVIPYGDWFNLVSSPHLLAEIVIYAGILVASGGRDLTVWLVFLFVVANLTFAAAETQRWYERKFDNYPKKRYAIVPYVY